jgi:hypothetical protein
MMLKQYVLQERESQSVMVCWLEIDPRVKVGTVLTLKEIPDRTWVVSDVFTAVKDRTDIKRGWHNNI